jgi:hypothetical protein
MDSGSVLKSGKFTKWIALPVERMRKYFSISGIWWIMREELSFF